MRWGMRTWQCPLVAAALLISMWQAGIDSAHAIPVLDQSYDSIASLVVGISGFGNTIGGSTNQQLGQTFTAGLPGLLTRVEVQISGFTGSQLITGPIALTLLNTLGGTLLASGTIPIASIPSSPGFVGVDVSSFGVMVSPGNTFAIALSSTNTSSNVGWHTASTSNLSLLSNLYGGGTAYFLSGGAWIDQASSGTVGADRGFRTYVDSAVPEPSTWFLLILGMVCLGVWRRHDKHKYGE